MDTKEITVSDLAQEQIKNAERLFPLIRKKTEERKAREKEVAFKSLQYTSVEGSLFYNRLYVSLSRLPRLVVQRLGGELLP